MHGYTADSAILNAIKTDRIFKTDETSSQIGSILSEHKGERVISCIPMTLGIVHTGQVPSQLDKLLEQFINTPFPKWNDILSLMKKLGYIKIERRGSRLEFWNEEKGSSILLHKPHPDNTIKAYTKKDILDKLKKAGFINETL